MHIKVLGIDLAKNVFQLCAINQAGKEVFNRQVRRAKLASTVSNLEPDLIAMEACSSAHYWGRRFQSMGHRVALIPAQHVKAFVRVNKSDAHDALAIAEASQRPNLKTVPVKSLEQQDLQMISRQRQRWIRHRTAVVNQIRSTGREYGVSIPLGYRALKKALPDVLEDGDNELTPIARELIAEWAEELRQLDDKIHAAQERQKTLVRDNPAASALQEVPGFGAVNSAIVLSAVGDARQFTNGRQMAAWMGLVPRHTGTGGKTRMLSISKNGDRELRTMMIHGARAVIRWADQRDDALGRWVKQLQARRGHNKTVVALANKLARIAWVVIAKGERFDMNKAFSG
jgi:transposase